MSLAPLIIDLDGTLIRTDMFHESLLRLLRDSPLDLLRVPYWLARGKAVLKEKLAIRTTFDPSCLPYNLDLLEWLKQQRTLGRKLILCTASHLSIATSISNYLGFFDEVIASDGQINLSGKHKANALLQRFGSAGFDYAGNSNTDLAVWQRARRGIVVNASSGLVKKTQACCEIEQVISSPRLNLKSFGKVLRIHQWLKNLLLFAPIIAAHQLNNPSALVALIIAFLSFSLCASSVYISNDLLDLESDRQHPRKSRRPFAAGTVPTWVGILLVPLLTFCSLILALQVGSGFLHCLLIYFGLTTAYSFLLKRLVLIDCITLAILYTLRIIAGAAAVNIPLSFWLLTFSIFLFLSLALIKRYAELQVQLLNGQSTLPGRGYADTDGSLIEMQGIAAGYVAVLVLSLYLNSDIVTELYRSPLILWLEVPVLLFWISWIWMQAHRGKMHDDPLIFAVKDKTSLLTGVLFCLVLLTATLGSLW